MERLIRFTILADVLFLTSSTHQFWTERRTQICIAVIRHNVRKETLWFCMLFDVMDLLALFGVCAGTIFLTESALFCAIYSKATDTSGFRINICLGNSPRHPCTGCRNIIVPKYMMGPFYSTHILLESSEQLQLLDVALSRRVRNARQTQAAHHFRPQFSIAIAESTLRWLSVLWVFWMFPEMFPFCVKLQTHFASAVWQQWWHSSRNASRNTAP